MLFELATVVRVVDEAVAGQLMCEESRLAATHGVGLAGQRKRSGAGLADVSGQEMEVDQGIVLGDAGCALPESHAIKRQHRLSAADTVDQFVDACRFNAHGFVKRLFVELADKL